MFIQKFAMTLLFVAGVCIAYPCHAATALDTHAVTQIKTARWQTKQYAPGFKHTQCHFDHLFGRPQFVSVLTIAADSSAVRVELTAADVWGIKRNTIPVIAKAAGAVAAINGGIAPARRYPQVGYGMQKFKGKVWPFVNDMAFHPAAKMAGRNAIARDAKGQWHLIARGINSDLLHWPEDFPEMVDVMAGASMLVRKGQPQLQAQEMKQNSPRKIHPRTAMGITTDGSVLMVTVDGRHPGKAIGMTLSELATLMFALGAEIAIEFDGGGSTTMWIQQSQDHGVVNYPCDNKRFDHQGLRKLRLAILVMPRSKTIHFTPNTKH